METNILLYKIKLFVLKTKQVTIQMSESVQKQIAALQKRLAGLEKKVLAFESGGVKEKVKREPSLYNKFMSSEGTTIRKANPDWNQPQVMKEVARRWNEQKK